MIRSIVNALAAAVEYATRDLTPRSTYELLLWKELTSVGERARHYERLGRFIELHAPEITSPETKELFVKRPG